MPLERIRSARKIKPFIVLILIWLFTILTGAGASIVRAAVMFSLISIAQQINRKSSLINSLCCSAFILLCVDPFLLWDLGFQLSYAAVASIALFDQPIRELLHPENKLLQHFWNLTSISLAAQLLTIPICLYHFHQFPVLFLPANLIAVPMSTLILYGLIILLAISGMAFLVNIWGLVMDKLIETLNNWVNWLHHFSFASIDGIYILPQEAVCLYGLTTAIYLLIKGNIKKCFVLFSFFTLLFISIETGHRFSQKQKYGICVYQLKSETATELTSGGRMYLWGKEMQLKKHLVKGGILHQAHQYLRLDEIPYAFLGHSGICAKIGHKRILLIHKSLPLITPANCELAVISGNPTESLADFIHQSGVKIIIADNTNKTKQINEWRQICMQAKILFFPTAERGAFEMHW
jgi:competence protein ComEC